MSDELARVYLEYMTRWHQEGLAETDGEGFSEWNEVRRAIEEDPEIGWTFLLALIGLARDDHEVLVDIGAGPLEDLLRCHPARLLDRADAEARVNPSFRTALRIARLPGTA